MDFGLGIGYNPECSNTPSHPIQSRSAAVSSLKTGVMAQFKSSFVAASSNSQGQGLSNSSNTYANNRPSLPGFVPGGTIGGNVNRTSTTSSFNSPAPRVNNGGGQSSGENASQKRADRLVGLAFPEILLVCIFLCSRSKDVFNVAYSCTSRERGRERRRPSGWDR